MQETLEQIWDSIVSFFKVNRGIKLIALLLAILLWLYVVANNTYVYPIEVPIRVVNVPPGKTLASDVPKKVTARFRGKGTTLFKAIITLPYSDIYLRLDLRRVEKSETFYLSDYIQKTPDNFIIPRGYNLQLVEIVRPEVITVQLDEVGTKKVPVYSEIQVNAAPGYTQVGPVFFQPDSVQISGPAKVIESIDSISTERRDFEQADTREEGDVGLVNPSQDLIKMNQNETHFLIDVQTISERRITDIPVQVKNAPQHLEVTTAPSTVTLTVEGGSEYIFGINPSDVDVYFDYEAKWDPEKAFYVPQVEPPKYVLRWRDMSPNQVEVVVRRK